MVGKSWLDGYDMRVMQVAILDNSNQQVPTGKIGEVCIRGPNITKGYLNNPSANKEAYAGAPAGQNADRLQLPALHRDKLLLQVPGVLLLGMHWPHVSWGSAINECCSAAGGWFHTGDQGFLDGDGFLTLTGRIKELINRGGEKISPIEVRAICFQNVSIIKSSYIVCNCRSRDILMRTRAAVAFQWCLVECERPVGAAAALVDVAMEVCNDKFCPSIACT